MSNDVFIGTRAPLGAIGSRRQRRTKSLSMTLALSTAALTLGACTVGPDYHGAPVVAPQTLSRNAFIRTPERGVSSAPGVAAWWRELHDPVLDALIDQALANNPDIQASEARLRAARASLSLRQANLLPKFQAGATAIRTPRPELLSTTGSGPLSLYSVTSDATWEIDLFGGSRRAIEAASANAQAIQANLADTHVSLAAEVAQTYVDFRAQQQRAAIIKESAAYEQHILDLTQQRRLQGTAGEADVERSRTQVDTTRASIAPLDADLGESLDRLAVLCGQEPGALDARLLSSPTTLPNLPATVDIGDPAAMLKHRPDIRAAERKLASMNATIGQNVADYFPKLSLFGELGFSATAPSQVFRQSSRSWLTVPYITWNFLDFGRTTANVHAATAQRDEAEANYRKAVLEALRDADSALSRYGHQRENVVQLMSVDASAQRSASLVEQRYRAGASSMIDWLDAERTQLSARQNLVNGQAQLVKNFVLVQKSLGLGWQSASTAQ